MDWIGWISLRWPLYILLQVGIPQKKWSSRHGPQKSPKYSTWMQSQNNRIISICFQGKPFNITVIQVHAPTTNAEEAKVEQFYKYLQDLLKPNTKNRCPFHYWGLEYKCRKSRDTWSNRQVWPWSRKWSRAKPNRVLLQECTGIASTLFQQHKIQLYKWTSPDGQYWNQIDYILCSWRWRSSINQQNQDQELTVAPIKNSLLQNSDLNWRK